MGNISLFNEMAERYETPDRVHTAKVSAERIKQSLNQAKGKTAIDFGCGTGLVGFYLAEQFEQMMFIDASPNMIAYVQEKIQRRQIKNAQAQCIDLEQEAGGFVPADYMFVVQVLLHIEDTEAILKKLYRFLKPKGHLLIVDFDKNEQVNSALVHPGFQQQQLADQLYEAGFGAVVHQTFYQQERLFMNTAASLFFMDAVKI